MRLPGFNWVAPSSLKDATEILRSERGRAKLLAGGTDLLIAMKQRFFNPDHVIDLKNIPGLSGIRETGQVKILNVTSGNDVGTPLNPPAMEGQVEGAILQGIGFSLSEEMIYRDGHLLNPSLMASQSPNVFDMPEEEIFFTKTYDPYGPFGAKGGASLAQSTAAAAIANAIYDAIGIRFRELPITPEKVQSALRLQSLDQKRNEGRQG
jgi:hypothetical protein